MEEMQNLDYGVIGNGTSAALVSASGSIDWCCLPDFSSSSVFAALLDQGRGGTFGIKIAESYRISQKYIPRTNILVTVFSSDEGAFEILDFMPRYKTESGTYVCPPEIVRFVRYLSGSPQAVFCYDPKLCYAQHETTVSVEPEFIKAFTEQGEYESLYLYTDLDLQAIVQQKTIVISQDHYLLVSYNQKILPLTMNKIYLDYQRTKLYWLEWVDRTVHYSMYYDEIIRSALVLKLLSYQKTGAIIAAVTTSLPETIGEVRNWDYRFCWIRDASMIITILTNLGHYNAAERFLKFILDVVPYKKESMQIMYGINREKALTELELPWLAGYENSRPVRIGNKAYTQKQNDIYGVLLDVIHKYFILFPGTFGKSEELWTMTRSLVRTVILNWKKPDMGIWEFRTQKRNFVFSKVLCWVAMDRGVKIAEILHKTSYIEQWSLIRDRIKDHIYKHGWNEVVGAFTQTYDNTAMDAANLLMATYGFIDYRADKYIKTVHKINETLGRDGLLYRYLNEDDFGRPHSSFTICSFWMVKSLYKIGEKKQARELFEKLLGFSNHLDLFSEDLDFKSKRLLGNFPQGYSHLALIDAALVLAEGRIDEEDQLMTQIDQAANIKKE